MKYEHDSALYVHQLMEDYTSGDVEIISEVTVRFILLLFLLLLLIQDYILTLYRGSQKH